MKAGLMWSIDRGLRKTHVFLVENEEDKARTLCKLYQEESFLWDITFDLEKPAKLLKRIERTDADDLVCRSCRKALVKSCAST